MDDVNGFKVEVRERDGGTASGSFSYRMTGGKTWRFHHWIYRNTAYLDNYVERTDSSRTTYYIGNHYEVSTPPTATTKYYYFGTQRVAMNQGGAVTYLHGDHLGSTSVATNPSGAMVSRQTYYAFGAPRTTEGTLPTDYTFTGQKFDASDGLMYYGARYYDAALGRFISADTIVPNVLNPQNLNRYAYVLNNPLRYTDPTGHLACGGPEDLDCDNPSGVGTPGQCDLSCVEPPAATQGEQNPSGGVNPADVQGASPAYKSLHTPATFTSYGWLAGAFENFWTHGWDIVFEWDTSEIGIFEWDARSPNGFVTPQAGFSTQQGYIYGMNQIEDYAGVFDVSGGNATVFTGGEFFSEDKSVHGFEGGVTLSVPQASIYSYTAEYEMKSKIEVHPIIMEILPYVLSFPFPSKLPPY